MRDDGGILGKAEVGSSILPNGTTKSLENSANSSAPGGEGAARTVQIRAEPCGNAPIPPGDRREMCARVVRPPRLAVPPQFALPPTEVTALAWKSERPDRGSLEAAALV
ncbi:MAG TPA: hypothetical protein DHW63_07905 [Hyphomonadaceae bacterium]|nr:hypothetical protein [Hyphomonadaceae bacterium]